MPAASNSTTPALNTIGFDTAPTAIAPTATAVSSGHMLRSTGGWAAGDAVVASSDIAETLPSRV